MKVQITFELLVNTLIKIYKEKKYHEDFQKLNQIKLSLLNKYLFNGKENIILYDKGFILKAKKLNLDENFYINHYLNKIMNNVTKTLLLSIDELTPTDYLMNYKKNINEDIANRVIKSHQDQINNEYKELIKNTLKYCFDIPLSCREDDENSENVFNINIEMSEEDSLEFERSLDENNYL